MFLSKKHAHALWGFNFFVIKQRGTVNCLFFQDQSNLNRAKPSIFFAQCQRKEILCYFEAGIRLKVFSAFSVKNLKYICPAILSSMFLLNSKTAQVNSCRKIYFGFEIQQQFTVFFISVNGYFQTIYKNRMISRKSFLSML